MFQIKRILLLLNVPNENWDKFLLTILLTPQRNSQIVDSPQRNSHNPRPQCAYNLEMIHTTMW